MDPRIHFALVCGAKSCPPIKLYSGSNLEEGLNLAAEGFLEDSNNCLVFPPQKKRKKNYYYYLKKKKSVLISLHSKNFPLQFVGGQNSKQSYSFQDFRLVWSGLWIQQC